MQTTWTWSLATEANRILQTCKNIGNGFYHAHHFPILSWEPGVDYHPAAIYLPPFNYNSLPRFWHKVSKYDLFKLPTPDPAGFTPALVTKLATLNLQNPTDPKLVNLWDTHQDQVLSALNSLLPNTKDAIRSLTIYPTYFGTDVSFNIPSRFPADLHIFLRRDQDLTKLVEAVLTALTRRDAYDHFGALWSESELLVDYLLSRSSLTPLLSKLSPARSHQPTLLGLRGKIDSRLLTASRETLTSFGAPTFNQPFSLDGSHVLYNQVSLHHLTARETNLLKLLIEQSPNLVPYDSIADVIFESDDSYSLYTISKVVERLRKKLDYQGISSSYLVTTRNQGYYLKN